MMDKKKKEISISFNGVVFRLVRSSSPFCSLVVRGFPPQLNFLISLRGFGQR